jgi:hypothetical protein
MAPQAGELREPSSPQRGLAAAKWLRQIPTRYWLLTPGFAALSTALSRWQFEIFEMVNRSLKICAGCDNLYG